jgi:hypothetical protein
MFINTYNGRIFPEQRIRELLRRNDMQATELIPLQSDTALIVASRDVEALNRLKL